MKDYKHHRYQFAKKGLRYLLKNKRLLWFPTIGKISYLVTIIWLAHPLIQTLIKNAHVPFHDIYHNYVAQMNLLFFAILLVLLYINNVINTFCYGWLMASVHADLHGETKPVVFAWHRVKKQIGKILWWCVLRSLLGSPARILLFVLRAYVVLRDKLIGGSWHDTTYFSLLLISLGKSSAFTSITQSRELIRKQWGNNVVLRISPLMSSYQIGLAFVCCLPFIISLHLATALAISTGLLITIILLDLFFIYEETLGHIYCTILYCFAAENHVVKPFEKADMEKVFITRYSE